MTKTQLKQALLKIQNRYEATEAKHKHQLYKKSIEDLVHCLNNPDLKAHLLNTEIAPIEEEAEEMLEDYSTAEGIISELEYHLSVIKEFGLIQEKQTA